MNQVVITGRVVKTPELRNSNGINYTKFSVASRRSKEHTDFIDFVAFKDKAEYISKYAKQGYNVTVRGTVEQKKYPKNGTLVSTYNFIVKNIDIAFPPTQQAA